MQAAAFSLIPMVATLAGALVAMLRPLGERAMSALQHLAAGVVFAAAATEILPQVMHHASPAATVIGGGLGVLVMLGLKEAETRLVGQMALLGAIGIDLLVDGLVLGLAFVAGQKAGLLLAVALTLEVLFLAMSLATDLMRRNRSKLKVVFLTVGMALLLPIGSIAAIPVAQFPPVIVAGFLSFGLMALLYLVTEELLVEAHRGPDSPLISSLFFVGFLALLVIEEAIG